MEYVKMGSKTVKDCYIRLCKAKAILDSTDGVQILDLKRKLKGSAQMYSILTKDKIIIKTDNGYKWKGTIPPTKTLARTICNMLRNKQIEYEQKNKSKYAPIKIDAPSTLPKKDVLVEDKRKPLIEWQKNLRSLRESKGISANQMAESLGVTTRTIYRWESAKIKILPQWVVKINKTLNGGLEIIKSDKHIESISKDEIRRWQESLRDTRIAKNVSPIKLAKEVGVSYQTYSRWERLSTKIPNEKMDMVNKILSNDLKVTKVRKAEVKHTENEVVSKIALTVWQSKLKDRRIDLGFTEQEMADKLGILKISYQRWERLKKNVPSKRLKQIEDIFSEKSSFPSSYQQPIPSSTVKTGRPKGRTKKGSTSKKIPLKRMNAEDLSVTVIEEGKRQQFVLRTFKRLKKIEEILSSNRNISKSVLSSKVGGANELYDVLLEEGVLIKAIKDDKTGYCCLWNIYTNLTEELANDITEKIRKKLRNKFNNEPTPSFPSLPQDHFTRCSKCHDLYDMDKEGSFNNCQKCIDEQNLSFRKEEEPKTITKRLLNIDGKKYDVPLEVMDYIYKLQDAETDSIKYKEIIKDTVEVKVGDKTYIIPRIVNEAITTMAQQIKDFENKENTIPEGIDVDFILSKIEELLGNERIISMIKTFGKAFQKNKEAIVDKESDIPIGNVLSEEEHIEKMKKIFGSPLSEHPKLKGKKNITLKDVEMVFGLKRKPVQYSDRKTFELSLLWGVFKITVNK